jgi:hypothetical protein
MVKFKQTKRITNAELADIETHLRLVQSGKVLHVRIGTATKLLAEVKRLRDETERGEKTLVAAGRENDRLRDLNKELDVSREELRAENQQLLEENNRWRDRCSEATRKEQERCLEACYDVRRNFLGTGIWRTAVDAVVGRIKGRT